MYSVREPTDLKGVASDSNESSFTTVTSLPVDSSINVSIEINKFTSATESILLSESSNRKFGSF